MKKVIFSKYSNERAREFAIRTDILEDEDKHRIVRKTACYPEGKQHIRNLVRWYQELSEVYADTPISINRCVLTEDGLEPEFVQGHTLEEELDEMLVEKDVQGCVQRLMEYIDAVRKAGSAQRFYVTEEFEKVFGSAILPGNLTSAMVTDIDMLVSNVIVADNSWVHMDYEWTFEFPVPVNFVIYRMLMYYMEKGSLRAALRKEDLYRYAGLTKQEIAQYERMEACFQQYLLGGSVPLRLLYRHISAGYVDFQSEEKRRKQAVLSENAQLQAAQTGKTAIEICIDTVEEAAGMVFIQGWAVSRALRPLDFTVYDNSGREWNIEEVRFMKRQDVNLSFGITDPDYCAGFRICGRMQPVEGKKVKSYVLTVRDGASEASLTIHTDRLRIKNSRVGKKLLSLRDGKPRHEIHYITPYEMGLFGEKDKFHCGEQRYDSFCRIMELTDAAKKEQQQTKFKESPLISIVTELKEVKTERLEQMLESVCAQTYPNWELCLVSEKEDAGVKKILDGSYRQEKRIHYIAAEESAGCLNTAFERAEGDYVMETGQEDMLAPDALFEIVKFWDSQRNADIIYTDEDSVDASGKIFTDPLLKPDYNLYMLRSMNYIGHGFAVKKEIVQEIGGMRREFGGAQGYDFVLRCCETAKEICHIPRILYHCRRESGQKNPAAISEKWDMGREALMGHYRRMKVDAQVEWAQEQQTYRTRWKCKGMPKVSVIIPNMDHAEDLEKCIRSIVDKTEYGNYEIVIVENNSREKKTFACYDKLLREHPQVRVLNWKDEFNYAAINNFAARETDGEYLLFLNNDTEVISRGWMKEMLGICQQPQVGIVGAKLYYPDDTIQHAGVIIGLSGIAGHLFLGEPGGDNGYMARAGIMQNLSAVTAACMMTSREAFTEAGGFDEKLKVALNDVDYCLKVVKSGRMVVYTPHAELYHYESKSRGMEDTPQKKARYDGEVQYFKERWAEVLRDGDPFYHPNLSLTSWACALSVPQV